MNHETVFRLIAFVTLFVGVGISIYFRHKATRETGEAISRNVDGKLLMNIIRLGGLVLWLSPILYLLNPAWMAWSKIGLSEGLRWLGVGPGILCNLGIYWLFQPRQQHHAHQCHAQRTQTCHQRPISLGAASALHDGFGALRLLWAGGR